MTSFPRRSRIAEFLLDGLYFRNRLLSAEGMQAAVRNFSQRDLGTMKYDTQCGGMQADSRNFSLESLH